MAEPLEEDEGPNRITRPSLTRPGDRDEALMAVLHKVRHQVGLEYGKRTHPHTGAQYLKSERERTRATAEQEELVTTAWLSASALMDGLIERLTRRMEKVIQP